MVSKIPSNNLEDFLSGYYSCTRLYLRRTLAQQKRGQLKQPNLNRDQYNYGKLFNCLIILYSPEPWSKVQLNQSKLCLKNKKAPQIGAFYP